MVTKVACVAVVLATASGCAANAGGDEDVQDSTATLATPTAPSIALREVTLDPPSLQIGQYWIVEVDRSGAVRSSRVSRSLPSQPGVGLDARSGVATLAVGATASGLRAYGPGMTVEPGAPDGDARCFCPRFRFRFWDLLVRIFD